MSSTQQLLLTEGGGAAPNYIEDVFSTYLWDGNATARNIVNGIDLATKGGMVWAKYRNVTASNRLYDTARGATKQIFSDLTNAEQTAAQSLTSFNTDGFSLGTGQPNENTATVVGWTFRKQPKFFDVVTWTGDGNSSRVVSHSLTSQPGFIIIKRTDTTSDWIVAASDGSGNYKFLNLNTTSAALDTTTQSNVASTTGLNVGWISSNWAGANASGGTYVSYVYASNAGGFGLTGTDNVISCGSFTSSFSGVSVDLGYEPQWVMVKNTDDVGLGWYIWDGMRGFPVGTSGKALTANSSDAETTTGWISPTATGFVLNPSQIGGTHPFIYIAIRRGPMKVPTDATKVFSPNLSAASTGTNVTTNFPIDLQIQSYPAGPDNNFVDRLRGVSSTSTAAGPYLRSTTTAAEAGTNATLGWSNTAFQITAGFSGASTVYYNFRRAPSFFDEVCDTGTGAAHAITHNLGVTPELIIRKTRSDTGRGWPVYAQGLGATKYVYLDQNYAEDTWSIIWNNTAPTSTQFTVGTGQVVNNTGATYVTYLFATCAGVSKVGSYTGTGTTKQVDCGFAAGARFVLIKRTDSTGDWYVWDSARGIVAGNDPYLLLNSTAAEVTNTDYVDTYSAGFEISSTAPAAINASGGTFIFLAIA